MRQPLPTSAPATDLERAPSDPAAAPGSRRGACWYALMRPRHAWADDHAAVARPRPRAIHWSRTIEAVGP